MLNAIRFLSTLSLVASLVAGCGNGKCDPSLPSVAGQTCQDDASEVTVTPEADEAPVGDDDGSDDQGDDDAAGDDDNSEDDNSSAESPTPGVESSPVEVETPAPVVDDTTPIADTPTPEIEETPVQATPISGDEETATPGVESTPEVTPSAEETPAETSPTPPVVVDPTPPVEDGDDASTPSPAPTEPPGEEWVEVDTDGDGYMVSEGDCVEGDANTYPGAAELQDWVDNDCDGFIDNECNNSCRWDYESYRDGQGYCRDDVYAYWVSGKTDLTWECTGEVWYVQLDADQDGYDSSDDCNDTNADTYPGAAELQDWVDNDCDGVKDNGCSISCNWDYVSVAEDGTQCRDDRYAYWVSDLESDNDEDLDFTWECTGTSWRVEVDVDADGYVASTGDCSEGDPDTYPGAPELQDWLDNDCDGVDDDGCNNSCGWDYISVAEDGTQCRDDVYAYWLSDVESDNDEDLDFTWECTGTTWRASP